MHSVAHPCVVYRTPETSVRKEIKLKWWTRTVWKCYWQFYSVIYVNKNFNKSAKNGENETKNEWRWKYNGIEKHATENKLKLKSVGTKTKLKLLLVSAFNKLSVNKKLKCNLKVNTMHMI